MDSIRTVAALARLEQIDAGWLRTGLDDAFALVAGRFKRREVRLRARACLHGLLSGLERKNGWTLAEYSGDRTPDGVQRLFSTARWDVDGVRDDVRDYVLTHLGDARGVLTGDDTGFQKRGAGSAGVQRQYTGTAGKITNCQIGVFLAYAGPRGRALIDRERYLPASWLNDPGRCAVAKAPEPARFATKPQLLQAMIERAVAAGVTFAWVSADEAHGGNGPLRRFMESRRIGYVLAVSCDHQITTGLGKVRADRVAAWLPAGAWQRMSCGDGSKGRRWYDWALVATTSPAHRLLIRRSACNPAELAFFLSYSPSPAPLAELVAVSGSR
ncbi:IS701 family transposase [Streptosporangium sp. KLBMP 9127]|nr:IS701 family transposase [Streptosporangium sp. KLBMP 9127]